VAVAVLVGVYEDVTVAVAVKVDVVVCVGEDVTVGVLDGV
jgi:hypothetical protein